MRRFLAYFCVVACLACLSTVSKAADWPQFRGPGGLGRSDAKNLPQRWNEAQNLAWKIRLPGAGASSPIALGDKLYVTCYSGYGVQREPSDGMEDLKLHVVCLDRADGSIIWDREIEPTLPESSKVKDHGYAAATPATDGEHLYVFFGKSGVFKFDLDGNPLWRSHVGSGTHGWGCGTSPVLYEDLVIVNASVESGDLVALHKRDGNEAWRAAGMNSSWNTPHLVELPDGNHELVLSIRGRILGFDPRTGQRLWDCAGIEDYVCPSVVSQNGIVYAIGGRKSRAIAVRAGGRGEVTEIWREKAGANVSSPVIHDEHLYWVSDRNKTAYCLRLEDGHIVYAKRFPNQPYASTMFADGKLYVVTRYDGTYVLAAKPSFQLIAHNQFDDESTFNASPIVAGSKLILRSDRFLYAVSAPEP